MLKKSKENGVSVNAALFAVVDFAWARLAEKNGAKLEGWEKPT
jgi:hypothetical protein